MTRRRQVLVCGLVLALASAAAARAEERTVTVDPALCTVIPLTRDRLIAVAATPPAGGPSSPETGADVPDETLESIETTIRESIACTNANDIMAAFALFTDRYLGQRFGGEGNDDLGHLLAALTRDPAVAAEEDRLALIAIDNAALRGDGSVTVTVTTESGAGRFVDALALVPEGERWLIDRVEHVSPPAVRPDA